MQTIDTTAYVVILIFVIGLFYVAAVEIRKSLFQAKASEKNLEKEKVVLLSKIESQTREIKKVQDARMNELLKVAEFGRLSQGLFHDLMTPLSSIILHTEKLQNTPKSDIESTQKTLKKAADASARMANYIHNVRKTMQRESIEQECDLFQELREVADLLAYKARSENVSITLPQEKKLLWFGDAIKMRQIFSNLISNAIDSFDSVARDENRIVTISLEKNADSITISVEDNGCGIPKENLKKIFDPFFTTKSPEKGTGIGLTSIKSIIENELMGTVRVESAENRGSVFTVTIPSAPASSPLRQHI